MTRKNRSNSAVVSALILAVFLCTAMAAASSTSTETAGRAAPAKAETAVSGRDPLAMANSDSMRFARTESDLREHARFGWAYRIRYSGFGDWYVRGGAFMHPLLGCSIAGAVFIIERIYALNRARVDTKALMEKVLSVLHGEGIEGALKVCEATRGPIASVLHAGMLRARFGAEAVREAIETAGVIEVSFLKRGLVVIATAATVAPMLGFLGTASRMMNVLAAIAAAEHVSAKIVASGIGEALIPTIAGLCIAIPCTIGHSYCIGTIDRFVLEMEEASANLVNELAEVATK
jgi:biopolymer transport protein ExbB